MSIMRRGWTNGNCEERTLNDINEHRSNLPFAQDWPKAAFLDRNYASLPPIFVSQLRKPPTSSPLPTKQCFIRDKSNINATGATVTTEHVFRSGSSLTRMKIKIIFCNFLRNAVTKIPCCSCAIPLRISCDSWLLVLSKELSR